MTSCELCGKTSELYRTLIEETELLVCKSCSSFGKVLKKVDLPTKKLKEQAKEEVFETVVGDFHLEIKRARENLGLTQKEFASKIRERESLVQKIESGHLKPSIALARKLEQTFNLKLVEEIKDDVNIKGLGKGKSAGFTIGDIIKKD